MGKKSRPPKKVSIAKVATVAKRAAPVAAAVAAVGGLAYAGEKMAERLGVRGGAGFIGRRKGRKSRKKSASFYAREILRLKLKKRYDKIKLGIGLR